ncbi:hypothetical protein SMACR_00491 [Sordaria macrospora]|nr:hypothetical protein SMACR_00491 [Sordaria macrospora]
MVGISYLAKGYRQIGGHRPFSKIEVVLLISLASFTTSLIIFSIVYSAQHRGPLRPALVVSISGSMILLLAICYIVYSRIHQARQDHDLENQEDGQSSPSSYTINTSNSPSTEYVSPNMRFAPAKDFRNNRNRPFWASSTTILPANAADEERLLDYSSEQQYIAEKDKERKLGTSRGGNLEKTNNIKIIITEPEPVASRHGMSLEFDPLRSHPVELGRGTTIKQSGTLRNLTAIPRSVESDKTASNRNHSVGSGSRTPGPSSASRSSRHHHLRKSRRPTISSVGGRQDLRASIRRAAIRSALSASRAITTQAPAASFSASVARTALVSSRIQAIRFFSQSPRVLNTEETTQTEQTEQTETETAPAATEEAAVKQNSSPAHTAFVRNIVFDATEEHLKGAFEKFGDVTDVFLAKDARGLSKGYGFVTFATKEALEEACSQVDGSFWHGRRISTTDAELNNIFIGIDGLKDVRVAVDRATGWPRGFAHADFVDVEAAVNALEKLQGVQLGERTVKLDYAQPSTPRQPRENNGERREYNRDGGNRSYNREGGNRSYGNRDGGNRSFNREGGNRSYGNREGGQRSYNREGGNRNYNRRDQGESTEF